MSRTTTDRNTFRPMTGAELGAALDALGLTNWDAAQLLGQRDAQRVRDMREDVRPVSAAVALLVDMASLPGALEDLRDAVEARQLSAPVKRAAIKKETETDVDRCPTCDRRLPRRMDLAMEEGEALARAGSPRRV